MRTEIRIAGFGGQGVALAGYILGKAVTLHTGLQAVMTQSYGPEARGGASSASLVVADERIDYPFVERPDVLVALSQEAHDRFAPLVKPAATILIDIGLVTGMNGANQLGLPATEIAEQLGRRIVANVVMLGFLTRFTALVDRDGMEKTIESSVKPGTVTLNLEAFDRGYCYDRETITPERNGIDE